MNDYSGDGGGAVHVERLFPLCVRVDNEEGGVAAICRKGGEVGYDYSWTKLGS